MNTPMIHPAVGLRKATVSTTDKRFTRQAIALGLGAALPGEAEKIAEKRRGLTRSLSASSRRRMCRERRRLATRMVIH
jgi:hypothetical protein